MKRVSIAEITLEDRAEYAAAGLDGLVAAAVKLLAAAGVELGLMPAGKGSARLANLLAWRVEDGLELIDDLVCPCDQVIHMAAHQWMDSELGHDDPHGVLTAEAVASAVDFWLLGRLADAGREPDFIAETLESFTFYFERYGGGDRALEALLETVLAEPWTATSRLVRYLSETGSRLLYPTGPERLITDVGDLVGDDLYPLLHHYNMGQWIAAMRARFPEPRAPRDRVRRFQLPETEEAMIAALERAATERCG